MICVRCKEEREKKSFYKRTTGNRLAYDPVCFECRKKPHGGFLQQVRKGYGEWAEKTNHYYDRRSA
jgi:hypothetical protein